MGKFKTYIEETDWLEYNQNLSSLIEQLEQGNELNESLLDSLSKKMKAGIAFIKKISELTGFKLLDLLKIFKNKTLFTFFSKIGWSISKLVSIVKQGYKLYQNLQKIITKYIADTGVVKWTHDKLVQLDNFLSEHPIIKKAGALVVAGFLIYQWTQMISFTGDIEFDFDQSLLFAAIAGSYSLAKLFATEEGIQMLLFIATKTLTGISFPWPGNTWLLFALSIIYTASKDKYPQIAKAIIKNVKKYK